MKSTIRFASLRAGLEILLWRHGVLPLVAVGTLLAGLIAAAWIAPQQYGALSRDRAALAALERRSAEGDASKPTLLPPAVVFEQTLAEQAKSNEVIRRVFELAGQQGVSVAQADYRRSPDAAGQFSQLQIALPVKGAYGQIKRYSMSLLAEIPSLSIDQMTLKREAPTSMQVEGQLLLSVWQKSEANTQVVQGASR